MEEKDYLKFSLLENKLFDQYPLEIEDDNVQYKVEKIFNYKNELFVLFSIINKKIYKLEENGENSKMNSLYLFNIKKDGRLLPINDNGKLLTSLAQIEGIACELGEGIYKNCILYKDKAYTYKFISAFDSNDASVWARVYNKVLTGTNSADKFELTQIYDLEDNNRNDNEIKNNGYKINSTLINDKMDYNQFISFYKHRSWDCVGRFGRLGLNQSESILLNKIFDSEGNVINYISPENMHIYNYYYKWDIGGEFYTYNTYYYNDRYRDYNDNTKKFETNPFKTFMFYETNDFSFIKFIDNRFTYSLLENSSYKINIRDYYFNAKIDDNYVELLGYLDSYIEPLNLPYNLRLSNEIRSVYSSCKEYHSLEPIGRIPSLYNLNGTIVKNEKPLFNRLHYTNFLIFVTHLNSYFNENEKNINNINNFDFNISSGHFIKINYYKNIPCFLYNDYLGTHRLTIIENIHNFLEKCDKKFDTQICLHLFYENQINNDIIDKYIKFEEEKNINHIIAKIIIDNRDNYNPLNDIFKIQYSINGTEWFDLGIIHDAYSENRIILNALNDLPKITKNDNDVYQVKRNYDSFVYDENNIKWKNTENWFNYFSINNTGILNITDFVNKMNDEKYNGSLDYIYTHNIDNNRYMDNLFQILRNQWDGNIETFSHNELVYSKFKNIKDNDEYRKKDIKSKVDELIMFRFNVFNKSFWKEFNSDTFQKFINISSNYDSLKNSSIINAQDIKLCSDNRTYKTEDYFKLNNYIGNTDIVDFKPAFNLSGDYKIYALCNIPNKRSLHNDSNENLFSKTGLLSCYYKNDKMTAGFISTMLTMNFDHGAFYFSKEDLYPWINPTNKMDLYYIFEKDSSIEVISGYERKITVKDEIDTRTNIQMVVCYSESYNNIEDVCDTEKFENNLKSNGIYYLNNISLNITNRPFDIFNDYIRELQQNMIWFKLDDKSLNVEDYKFNGLAPENITTPNTYYLYKNNKQNSQRLIFHSNSSHTNIETDKISSIILGKRVNNFLSSNNEIFEGAKVNAYFSNENYHDDNFVKRKLILTHLEIPKLYYINAKKLKIEYPEYFTNINWVDNIINNDNLKELLKIEDINNSFFYIDYIDDGIDTMSNTGILIYYHNDRQFVVRSSLTSQKLIDLREEIYDGNKIEASLYIQCKYIIANNVINIDVNLNENNNNVYIFNKTKENQNVVISFSSTITVKNNYEYTLYIGTINSKIHHKVYDYSYENDMYDTTDPRITINSITHSTDFYSKEFNNVSYNRKCDNIYYNKTNSEIDINKNMWDNLYDDFVNIDIIDITENNKTIDSIFTDDMTTDYRTEIINVYYKNSDDHTGFLIPTNHRLKIMNEMKNNLIDSTEIYKKLANNKNYGGKSYLDKFIGMTKANEIFGLAVQHQSTIPDFDLSSADNPNFKNFFEVDSYAYMPFANVSREKYLFTTQTADSSEDSENRRLMSILKNNEIIKCDVTDFAETNRLDNLVHFPFAILDDKNENIISTHPKLIDGFNKDSSNHEKVNIEILFDIINDMDMDKIETRFKTIRDIIDYQNYDDLESDHIENKKINYVNKLNDKIYFNRVTIEKEEEIEGTNEKQKVKVDLYCILKNRVLMIVKLSEEYNDYGQNIAEIIRIVTFKQDVIMCNSSENTDNLYFISKNLFYSNKIDDSYFGTPSQSDVYVADGYNFSIKDMVMTSLLLNDDPCYSIMEYIPFSNMYIIIPKEIPNVLNGSELANLLYSENDISKIDYANVYCYDDKAVLFISINGRVLVSNSNNVKDFGYDGYFTPIYEFVIMKEFYQVNGNVKDIYIEQIDVDDNKFIVITTDRSEMYIFDNLFVENPDLIWESDEFNSSNSLKYLYNFNCEENRESHLPKIIEVDGSIDSVSLCDMYLNTLNTELRKNKLNEIAPFNSIKYYKLSSNLKIDEDSIMVEGDPDCYDDELKLKDSGCYMKIERIPDWDNEGKFLYFLNFRLAIDIDAKIPSDSVYYFNNSLGYIDENNNFIDIDSELNNVTLSNKYEGIPIVPKEIITETNSPKALIFEENKVYKNIYYHLPNSCFDYELDENENKTNDLNLAIQYFIEQSNFNEEITKGTITKFPKRYSYRDPIKVRHFNKSTNEYSYDLLIRVRYLDKIGENDTNDYNWQIFSIPDMYIEKNSTIIAPIYNDIYTAGINLGKLPLYDVIDEFENEDDFIEFVNHLDIKTIDGFNSTHVRMAEDGNIYWNPQTNDDDKFKSVIKLDFNNYKNYIDLNFMPLKQSVYENNIPLNKEQLIINGTTINPYSNDYGLINLNQNVSNIVTTEKRLISDVYINGLKLFNTLYFEKDLNNASVNVLIPFNSLLNYIPHNETCNHLANLLQQAKNNNVINLNEILSNFEVITHYGNISEQEKLLCRIDIVEEEPVNNEISKNNIIDIQSKQVYFLNSPHTEIANKEIYDSNITFCLTNELRIQDVINSSELNIYIIYGETNNIKFAKRINPKFIKVDIDNDLIKVKIEGLFRFENISSLLFVTGSLKNHNLFFKEIDRDIEYIEMENILVTEDFQLFEYLSNREYKPESLEIIANGYTLYPNLDYFVTNLSKIEKPNLITFRKIIPEDKDISLEINVQSEEVETCFKTYQAYKFDTNSKKKVPLSRYITLDNDKYQFIEGKFELFIENRKVPSDKIKVINSKTIKIIDIIDYRKAIFGEKHEDSLTYTNTININNFENYNGFDIEYKNIMIRFKRNINPYNYELLLLNKYDKENFKSLLSELMNFDDKGKYVKPNNGSVNNNFDWLCGENSKDSSLNYLNTLCNQVTIFDCNKENLENGNFILDCNYNDNKNINDNILIDCNKRDQKINIVEEL